MESLIKKTAVVFLTFVITVALCACSKNELCGEWVSLTEGNTVTFNEGGFSLIFWDGDSVDGTFVIDKADEIDGVRHYTLTLRDSEGRKQIVTVKTDGDELTMANTIYKKQ